MMIQKFRWINALDITTNENQIALQNKINELVDVINAITIDVGGTKCVDGSKSAAKNMQDELERTRKALDVAVDALKRAHNSYCAEEEDIIIDLTESAAHKWQRTAYQMEMPISIALEQLTLPEQKD